MLDTSQFNTSVWRVILDVQEVYDDVEEMPIAYASTKDEAIEIAKLVSEDLAGDNPIFRVDCNEVYGRFVTKIDGWYYILAEYILLKNIGLYDDYRRYCDEHQKNPITDFLLVMPSTLVDKCKEVL